MCKLNGTCSREWLTDLNNLILREILHENKSQSTQIEMKDRPLEVAATTAETKRQMRKPVL